MNETTYKKTKSLLESATTFAHRQNNGNLYDGLIALERALNENPAFTAETIKLLAAAARADQRDHLDQFGTELNEMSPGLEKAFTELEQAVGGRIVHINMNGHNEPKEPATTAADLQEYVNELAKWSNKTFGAAQRNPAIAHHLKKEVDELIESLEVFQKDNNLRTPIQEANGFFKSVCYEYADCFMLLLDSAQHFGLSVERLMYYARKKLEINKARKWGKPDKNGVVDHLKNPKK